jgi:hypothetical protein
LLRVCHRLEAAKALGEQTIVAFLVDARGMPIIRIADTT